MVAPELPQELIDAIIEEVPQSSLPACSLVATSFLESSQKRLFRYMTLKGMPSYQKTARLLTGSPHLGKYVRYLFVDLGDIPPNYAEISSILGPLSEIEYLAIQGEPMFTDIAPVLAENPRVLELLSVPTLRVLALELVDIPSSALLQAFSSLEQVIISRSTIVQDEEQDEGQDEEQSEFTEPGNIWHLKVVSPGDNGENLAFVCHPRYHTLLKYLVRFSVMFPPVPDNLLPQFSQFLVACSDSLEYLEIELETPPIFPTLPTLTVLELLLDVELTKTPDLLHSIVASAVSSTPNLEVLIFAILDHPHGPHRPNRQQWTARAPADWAALDSALMDIAELDEVEFSLRSFKNADEGRFNAFVEFFEVHLPRANEAGFLGFTYLAAGQNTFVE
ncbi:hypothetical protein R3P38DRAFT_414465 [Favolaschia claudopus]|uniref:F-box domain-containing protein n=1 Tax=Favolaschia claudopus TaxID=2862362 RepID=A0AAV9ZI65_9AGAR